jgi:hypothetical protein
MAFSLRTFIMNGLRDAVGKMSDYKVILNAVGWMEKGVLTEEDLAELQALIDEKNTPVVEEVVTETDIPIEIPTDEN